MNGQLVYAKQNVSRLSNDLILLNDGISYKDTGILIGPDGDTPNFRLSYNTNDSTGHINATSINLEASTIRMPVIPATTSSNSFYLLIDASGNVTKGYSQYASDINQVLNSIQNNLSSIETQLATLNTDMQEIDPNQLLPRIRTSYTWIYILIGCVALLLITCIFFFVQWLRTSNRLSKIEERLGITDEVSLPIVTKISKPIRIPKLPKIQTPELQPVIRTVPLPPVIQTAPLPEIREPDLYVPPVVPLPEIPKLLYNEPTNDPLTFSIHPQKLDFDTINLLEPNGIPIRKI